MLPFKSGDIIRVAGGQYEIYSVEDKLLEQFRTLVKYESKSQPIDTK